MARQIRTTEPESPPTAPPWRNRTLHKRVAIGIGGVAVALVVGLFVIYPRVDKWQKNRVLRLAEHYLTSEDYRSAYLLMEPFVRKDPANFPARRLLARVYGVTSPEQALVEWGQLTQAEPDNAENFIGYAATALQTGRTDQLPAILTALEKLAPEKVEYRRLAAGAALAAGDMAALRQHVDRLSVLEPANQLTRFTRAALQLNSGDPLEAGQARQGFAEFARGDALRIRATLALINDAPRRWPDEKSPVRRFDLLADDLQLRAAPRYVAMRNYERPPTGLTVLVEHMETQPKPTANDVVLLAQWMIRVGQARDALLWLDTLDAPLRAAPVVRQTMAACASLLESWPRLEQLVTDGVWGPVPTEAVRLAFAARALRANGNDSQAGSQWSGAVRLCEQSQPGLQALQRLAQIWQWPERQTQVLRVLVRQFPMDEPAWRSLLQLAVAADNSAEYWRVHQARAQAAASNPAAQAERALAGLLVRPDESGLAPAADRLFQQHPGVPACRVAWALALWREGRAADALGVLDAAAINYAREPRHALVRGLVCAKAGQRAESDKMFALLQGVPLLPEERALIAEARGAPR